MGLKIEYGLGQTPLPEELKLGLKIKTITTRSELDRYEQRNIIQALRWLAPSKIQAETLLSASFLNQLHTKMYGDVWAWAGTYRTFETNIGVPYYRIGTELKQLLDDVLYWYHHQTYEPAELALRCKHRLVSIHCYPNGNGRHSRLVADLVMEKLYSLAYFPWGNSKLVADDEIRKTYIKALQHADQGEMGPLMSFAQWSDL